MSTVELLLDRVRSARGGTFYVDAGSYHLEAVAGRSDSVCFRLEEIARGVRVSLAEGFSLKGQLVYDQRSLPVAEIECIIRQLVVDRPATVDPDTVAGETLASVA